MNTGRLGFLANNTQEDVEDAVSKLLTGKYIIDKRTLLSLNYKDNKFGNDNFALNEFTVHKKDSSMMMTIHVSINGSEYPTGIGTDKKTAEQSAAQNALVSLIG